MGLLLLVLALFFGGFGPSAEVEPGQPQGSYTDTAPTVDPSKPPELWPKRSTHNAPDG